MISYVLEVSRYVKKQAKKRVLIKLCQMFKNILIVIARDVLYVQLRGLEGRRRHVEQNLFVSFSLLGVGVIPNTLDTCDHLLFTNLEDHRTIQRSCT